MANFQDWLNTKLTWIFCNTTLLSNSSGVSEHPHMPKCNLFPVDTGSKLKVQKTFRRRSYVRPIYVLCLQGCWFTFFMFGQTRRILGYCTKTKEKIFRIAFSAGLLRATASETRKYVPKLFSSFSEKYKISLRCFVDVIVYLLEILEK